MTTAIIGVGELGSRVARDLVSGGERVVLAARDQSSADNLARELGERASSAPVADAVSSADAVVLAVWLDTDKELIPQLSQELVSEVVIDPSNPLMFDDHGGFARSLPDDESAGSVVANLLPAGTHYVKAFGSMGADALGSAANREPERAVLFYATDDDTAAATAERLIRVSGFDPVKVGGIEAAGRIEMPGGDLHQQSGLDGRLLNIDEARAAV
jgi:predicted dinucleotide-binding enzyme